MRRSWVESNMGLIDYLSYNYTPSATAKSVFFYIQSAGHFCCGNDYYTRREGFKSYLLVYTVNGKGYARYRGRQYELGRGQVMLLDCYDYQEYYSDERDLWEIKWVHFNGGSSDGYYNIIYENYGPVINMSGNESIPGYIDALIKLMRDGDVQFEIKASNIIVSMLTDILVTAPSKPGNSRNSESNTQVESALEFVENNYSLDISLEDMANAACSSVFHFSRVFKKATGYSPYEYLIKYRINRAKSLLKTTHKTVEEISAEVGFESPSNFIRTFRQLEDMTPVKYRKYWTG